MNPELWYRLGDNGVYESAGQDFDALAGALVDAGIRHIDHWLEGGLEAGGFSGADYVSLFWGNGNAQWHNALTVEDQQEVETALERELVA